MLEYTILHELGHYYMHRNDPHPEEFTSLCRDESNSRTCDIDAFVTEYAATSAVEDYADTFAHIVYEKLYGYLPL
jgi:Zn-dependent peptidase ImmA (M78 family)